MKKVYILAGLMHMIALSAQQTPDILLAEKVLAQYDLYAAKTYSPEFLRSSEGQKKIAKEKREVLYFFEGRPVFLKETELRQNLAADADYITNGQIVGLNGSFNGDGIKVTVFDGGRIYGQHIAFDNLPNRITQKEAPTIEYSSHATAVAGFIGAKSLIHSFPTSPNTNIDLDIAGVAKNTLIDSYYYNNSTLPGDSQPKNVFQKILVAQPILSNHSYGLAGGWNKDACPDDANKSCYFWIGKYNPDNNLYQNSNGAYNTSDSNYDKLVYWNKDMVIVKAVGNSYGMGPNGLSTPVDSYYTNSNNQKVLFPATAVLPPNNCANGYDCIGTGSLAKNIIVVSATNSLSATNHRYIDPTNVVHSSYSSAGPRDDGGIKPDIAAIGTSVAHPSTNEDTIGSNSFGRGSGTSYSTPIVTGIIALWMQIHKSLFNDANLNASSTKVLLAHSAKEAGNPGPDAVFGWGFANAKDGADLLVKKLNNTVIFKNDELSTGTPKETIVIAGTEPIKATMSWVDPAFTNLASSYETIHNRRSSVLINDLDLRIIDMVTNQVYFPYKLNPEAPQENATQADNTVDNIEQVLVPNPVAGRQYKVVVSNKGSFRDDSGATVSTQDYSILISGYTQALGTKENSVNHKIQIVPTVTSDLFSVLNAGDAATVQMFDMSGKLISTIKAADNEVISVKGLPKGTYMVNVKTQKGETFNGKVIVK